MGVREYVLATSAEEAAGLAGEPGTVLMGGGTLLMPRATAGTLGAERVVGLHAAGLDYVQRNGATAIGAMSPLATLATLADLPALRSAAGGVGGWALRNTATLGGNLHAAAPYGDLAPVLLALDATVRLVAAEGERTAALRRLAGRGGRPTPRGAGRGARPAGARAHGPQPPRSARGQLAGGGGSRRAPGRRERLGGGGARGPRGGRAARAAGDGRRGPPDWRPGRRRGDRRGCRGGGGRIVPGGRRCSEPVVPAPDDGGVRTARP